MKKRTSKRGARAALIAAALGASAAFGAATSAQETGASVNRPIVAENRWVVVIDAIPPSESAEARESVEQARKMFCDNLKKTGVLADHIFVYTATAEDEARRPTRETFENILTTLRDVDGICELYATESEDEEKPFWRSVDDAPSETQVYVTALAFADPSGERDWIVPVGENVDELAELDAEARAERLVGVDELNDALLRPEDETSRPIQRTFLAINFQTPKPATRGDGAEPTLEDVVLNRAIDRVAGDVDDREVERYQHIRVLTKNERWDARTVDSFYQTMSEGLAGAADLAANGDGWVDAVELSDYVRANGRDQAVGVAQNGNAVYVLCEARRKWKPSAELFEEIEDVFTNPEYKKLKDSARKRAEKAKKGTTK